VFVRYMSFSCCEIDYLFSRSFWAKSSCTLLNIVTEYSEKSSSAVIFLDKDSIQDDTA
jgi:hypothetical protein